MSGSSSVDALTHAHRAALLAALAFALMVCMAAGEPWVWRAQIFRSPDGTSFGQGIAALILGIATAAVALAALVGIVPRRVAALTGVGTSAAALAMPLSLWYSLVGDADPIRRPGAEFMGTTEMWTAMFAAAAALAAMAIAWVLPPADDSETVDWTAAAPYALACAAVALAATATTWASGLEWTELGIERTEGLIALVAAFNGLLAAALAARGLIARGAFIRWAFAAGAAMLAAPLWFYLSTVGDADPTWYNLLVNCFANPCGTIQAGAGAMMSILAALGYLLATACTLPAPGRDSRVFASNWPLRA